MCATKIERRRVPADLVESTPAVNGAGYWVLASPMIVFVGWIWTDLFSHYSPIAWYLLDVMLAILVFVLFVLLPCGWIAHRLVTSAPDLFQNAGWDVRPLEPVREQEQYLVRYEIQARHRAQGSWGRTWLRAAQGWVYIEIASILVGAVLMVPLFFSAVDFGFGQ